MMATQPNAPDGAGTARAPINDPKVIHGDPIPVEAARKVVRRAPWREVGIVNAPWLLDHSVEHESWLERGFIYVALACPVVTNVHHQPETLELVLDDGSTYKYSPDFRVRLADGAVVICEVKVAKFAKDFARVHAAASALLRERGDHFMVVTEKQIHANARSARAILLMRYGRLHFTAEQADECKRLLVQEMAGSARVQDLIDRGVSEDLVWHMVASHALRTEVPLNVSRTEPVETNSPVENCLDHFLRWFGH